MNFSLSVLTNLYNIVVAVLVFIATLSDLSHFYGFEDIVVDLYVIGMSIAIFLLETIGSPVIIEHVPIMKTWLGRGILYIFLGALCLGHYVDESEQLPLYSGIIVMSLGLFAFLFHFLKFQTPIPIVVSCRGQEQVKMPTEQEERLNEPFLED